MILRAGCASNRGHRTTRKPSTRAPQASELDRFAGGEPIPSMCALIVPRGLLI